MLQNNKQSDYHLRCATVGDAQVGKTALAFLFKTNLFKQDYQPTTRVGYITHTIDEGDKSISLQIWDTAGQQDLRTPIAHYYKNKPIMIFIYDTTRHQTFQNIKNHWISQAIKYANINFMRVLVGNKIDILENRQVLFQEGQALAKQHSMLFFQTSAKTSKSVRNIFTDVVPSTIASLQPKKIINNLTRQQIMHKTPKSDKIFGQNRSFSEIPPQQSSPYYKKTKSQEYIDLFSMQSPDKQKQVKLKSQSASSLIWAFGSPKQQQEDLNKQIKWKKQELEMLEKIIIQKKQWRSQWQSHQIRKMNLIIHQLDTKISEKQKILLETKQKASKIEVECKDMLNRKQSLEVRITDNQQLLEKQDTTIEQLKTQLQQCRSEQLRVSNSLSQTKAKLQKLTYKTAAKQSQLAQLQQQYFSIHQQKQSFLAQVNSSINQKLNLLLKKDRQFISLFNILDLNAYSQKLNQFLKNVRQNQSNNELQQFLERSKYLQRIKESLKPIKINQFEWIKRQMIDRMSLQSQKGCMLQINNIKNYIQSFKFCLSFILQRYNTILDSKTIAQTLISKQNYINSQQIHKQDGFVTQNFQQAFNNSVREISLLKTQLQQSQKQKYEITFSQQQQQQIKYKELLNQQSKLQKCYKQLNKPVIKSIFTSSCLRQCTTHKDYFKNIYLSEGEKWKVQIRNSKNIIDSQSSLNSEFEHKSNFLYNSWKKSLEELKIIIKKEVGLPNLVSDHFWDYFIDKVGQFVLKKQEKIDFLNKVKQYVKVNLKRQSIAQDSTHFLTAFGLQMRQFISKLEKRKEICQKQINFMIENTEDSLNFDKLKFTMEQEQIINLSKKVKKYFAEDRQSFAFMSLYFHTSIKRLLENGRLNLQTIEGNLEIALQKILKIHPANSKELSEQLKKQSEAIEPKDIDIDYEFEPILFDIEKQNLFNQLKNFILDKAYFLKNDQLTFIYLTQPICQEKGYKFKSSLKIQSPKDNIFRTIQKLMKKYLGKRNQFQKLQNMVKKSIFMSRSQVLQERKKEKSTQLVLQQIIKDEIHDVFGLIVQILSEKKIPFEIKDLIRGKCVYNSIQDIAYTVQKLKESINEQGHQLIQLKNRLSAKTKDVVLYLQLNNTKTICELQLAFWQDYVQNEFNHKFYEFNRAQIFSKITNLFLNNIEWSTRFFGQIMYIFQFYLHETSKQGNINYVEEQSRKKLRKFAEDFLYPIKIFQQSEQTEKYKKEIDEQTQAIRSKLQKMRSKFRKRIKSKVHPIKDQKHVLIIQKTVNSQIIKDDKYKQVQRVNEMCILKAFSQSTAQQLYNLIHQRL